MSNIVRDHKIPIVRIVFAFALLTVTISMTSCRKAQGAGVGKTISTFASPQEAGAALLKAAKSGDRAALLALFGPDAKNILFSGDTALDQTALNEFATAYETMNRWGKIDAGGELLYVGADNFPFPIPLEKTSSGQWYFDAAEGADEILARRIGKDELVTIAALGALGNAEQQYFSQKQAGQVQQYASKFASDEGQRNGLYWPASKPEDQSPLGQMGDFATGGGYTNKATPPQPFNGYKFQILTKQGERAKDGAKNYIVNGNMTGGFAILAYPAEYQNSGIMTFLIGPDGIVYQKDLGEKTVELAERITEYNPGDGWEPANQ